LKYIDTIQKGLQFELVKTIGHGSGSGGERFEIERLLKRDTSIL